MSSALCNRRNVLCSAQHHLHGARCSLAGSSRRVRAHSLSSKNWHIWAPRAYPRPAATQLLPRVGIGAAFPPWVRQQRLRFVAPRLLGARLPLVVRITVVVLHKGVSVSYTRYVVKPNNSKTGWFNSTAARRHHARTAFARARPSSSALPSWNCATHVSRFDHSQTASISPNCSVLVQNRTMSRGAQDHSRPRRQTLVIANIVLAFTQISCHNVLQRPAATLRTLTSSSVSAMSTSASARQRQEV